MFTPALSFLVAATSCLVRITIFSTGKVNLHFLIVISHVFTCLYMHVGHDGLKCIKILEHLLCPRSLKVKTTILQMYQGHERDSKVYRGSTELDSDSEITTGPGSDIDEPQLQPLYPRAVIC